MDRADKVKIRTRTWQRSYGGDDYTFDDHQSMLHTLAAGKSFDITLDCTPKSGFVCDAAVTDAMVDDELATYNNVAISQSRLATILASRQVARCVGEVPTLPLFRSGRPGDAPNGTL